MQCAYLLVAVIAPLSLISQIARSSLTGTVTDPQGRRIPGATVHALENASGLERESITNSDGAYLLDSLPVGIYSVSFSKNGFSEFTAERVEEVVGHTRTLNARLRLAQAGAQRTTVTEPLVQLNKSDAAVSTVIERAQTRELPLNGRNWASLTALTPGATDTGASNQRTIRFAGHAIDDNNITLDGVDATAIYNQEQRDYVRLSIPLESIGEFQAQSQNFGADAEGDSRADRYPSPPPPARINSMETSSTFIETTRWMPARLSMDRRPIRFF